MTDHRTADERIRSALRSIERAQAELYNAMSDLSPVICMVKPWEDCGKLAERVKAFWHRLNSTYRSREFWTLDEL